MRRSPARHARPCGSVRAVRHRSCSRLEPANLRCAASCRPDLAIPPNSGFASFVPRGVPRHCAFLRRQIRRSAYARFGMPTWDLRRAYATVPASWIGPRRFHRIINSGDVVKIRAGAPAFAWCGSGPSHSQPQLRRDHVSRDCLDTRRGSAALAQSQRGCGGTSVLHACRIVRSCSNARRSDGAARARAVTGRGRFCDCTHQPDNDGKKMSRV